MMMAATANIFKDKEINNWFKACIGLNVTKEGLTNFVEMTIKKVHAAIGSSCGQCDIKQVKLGIISYHRFKGPSWKNTNAQGWKSNWWDIAKCYLPPKGYAYVSSVQESDFNAVINIILNCTDFKNYLSPSWLSPPPPDWQCPLEKVRQIGRDVRHSANCKTTDAELQDYFQILTRLLADPVCLAHDTSANIALSRLTDLQNDRLPLTEFGNLIQEFKQAIERVKDAAEEEFSEKAKHTLEKGFNKIKEAMKDSEEMIGKKMDENIQTLYDRTEYCKQRIGDQTSKAEHTIQTKTCVSITQIDTLTKSSVQLIEDHTRVNIERMQLKIDDKAEEDYERGLEVIKGRQVIESATMEGRDAVISATEASVTEIKATVIKGQQVVESATIKGHDAVSSATETGVTEVKATVIKGQWAIESATMEGHDAVTSATKACVTEVNATMIKGQQVVESATMEGRDAVIFATEAGVTEVKATVIKGEWVIESATMEGHDAVTSATEAGVTEVKATVIKGQRVVESATMEGHDAVSSATEAGVTEVRTTVIKGQQVIESAKIEGNDAITSATEAGVTEVKTTVNKGQWVIESATMEGHDAVTSATEAGVTEVNVTVIKGQGVVESATMEGHDALTSATEAGVTEVKATVIKGQRVIESATMEGCDAVTSATEAGVTELSKQAKTLLADLTKDSIGIKTQKEDTDFEMQCNGTVTRYCTVLTVWQTLVLSDEINELLLLKRTQPLLNQLKTSSDTGPWCRSISTLLSLTSLKGCTLIMKSDS
ncbi:hypothetical protein DPMN_179292 [Dreissena polymorpha]|uniref:Uncharacterized protein n=1 Tax=Dreissena polymorpha TaxID=45954 RepID=A0A9D4IM09_DREPO|nr:hypothetical protein DPMN_179292 [Dreissena polymorpha]